MAKVFLVDLENVGWRVLSELETYKLTTKDEIYIFYSSKVSKCPSAILKSISLCKANIQKMIVKNGTKNALDFQLVCFLGGKIKDSKHEFFIVSKDRDYSVLESFVSPVKLKLVNSFTFLERNNALIEKSKKSNKLKLLNKKEIKEVESEIFNKVISNHILEYSDYKSIAGSIFKQLVKSEDLEDFKERVINISNKRLYRDEIIFICSDYFV